MNPLFMLFTMILQAAFWLIIISVVMSWLVAFGVVNTRNQFAARLWEALNRLTEPLYRPVRKFLPTTFGGIDIAPVVVIFLIEFLKYSMVWLHMKYGL